MFGMTGFVLGPLIAVLFITFWEIFSREFNVMIEDSYDETNTEDLDSDQAHK
jgi:predicted PurR-regulated permease PerM